MLNSLIALATALESMAIMLATHNVSGAFAMLMIYLVHAGGSIAIAMAIWITLPSEMRRPRGWVLTLLFLTNLFVPLMPVVMRIAVFFGYRYRALMEVAPIVNIAEPEYSIYRASTGMQSRGGRVRTKLTNLNVPVEDRLTALLAIQETPARVSADLLRQLLADPIEDIRLLAYGMIDGKEKKIGVRILEEEQKLESALDKDVTYGCHKRLAELYWELVYQKLVQGDMMSHSCNQAREHALKAAEYGPHDAGLWFLLSRIAIELREPDEAQMALDNAERLGFPVPQLLPYRAELAFLQRRFEEVSRQFGSMTAAPNAMRLASVYRFWTR